MVRSVRARSFAVRRMGCYLVSVLSCGLLIAYGVGCGGGAAEEPAVELDWRLQPDPPHVGPATFTLALTDSTGRPITGADVEVEGNMAHAGMQPVFAEVTEQDRGRYIAPLEFTMAGDWIILVNVALPNGQTIERMIEVPGVQPR